MAKAKTIDMQGRSMSAGLECPIRADVSAGAPRKTPTLVKPALSVHVEAIAEVGSGRRSESAEV